MMNEPHGSNKACDKCIAAKERIEKAIEKINKQKQDESCDVEFLIAAYDVFVILFSDLVQSGKAPQSMLIAVAYLQATSKLLEGWLMETIHKK